MNGNTKGIIASLVVVVAAAGGFLYWQKLSASTPDTVAVIAGPAKYKDGTYSADGSYGTPGGEESVHVTLTLAGGVITDSEFVPAGYSDVSKNYMSRFAAGYKTQVVGKYIDAVQVKTVSGASLTPKGFMTALVDIQAKAKS